MYSISNLLNRVYNVAIYIRLSREDEREGESHSIITQRSLLERYVEENKYNLYDEYVDDGFSGTNFDRPAFNRMLRDIESGKVNMVITKDLSRLGRDYIGTGEFIEKYFPSKNVRYIALTDNIDTALDSTNNDIAPFKAIMNDYYAKDISKKIRTSLMAKQKDGKWVGGCPPLGYMIDPKDKNHLVPNEEEAPIIRKIFELANEGKSTYAIREFLISNNIPTASMIRGIRGSNEIVSEAKKGYWSCKTIMSILTNQLYTGDLVQNRRKKVNYKIKKIVNNPKSEWIIVENTHESLVAKETFEYVGKIIKKNSNRPQKKVVRLLDGLLYCYECKHRLTILAPRKSDNRTYLVCNYYRMNSKRKLCTSHGFNYDYLEKGILKIIRNICKKYLDIENISSKVYSEFKKDEPIEKMNNIISKIKLELAKVNSNLDRMYLDKLEGKISEEMYERINNNLQEEISLKKSKIYELEQDVEKYRKVENTINDYKKMINNFIELQEPTREMMLQLIEKIEVHDNKRIDIYFNFKELNFLLSNS